MAGFSFLRRGQTIYAMSAPWGWLEPLAGLRAVSVGLPFARRVGGYLKPTSAALRLLDAWVTRNRLRLGLEQALELLAAGQIGLEHGLQEGYVLLECSGLALGCGLALRGRIKSQIPRRETRALLCRGFPGQGTSEENPG